MLCFDIHVVRSSEGFHDRARGRHAASEACANQKTSNPSGGVSQKKPLASGMPSSIDGVPPSIDRFQRIAGPRLASSLVTHHSSLSSVASCSFVAPIAVDWMNSSHRGYPWSSRSSLPKIGEGSGGVDVEEPLLDGASPCKSWFRQNACKSWFRQNVTQRRKTGRRLLLRPIHTAVCLIRSCSENS